MKQNYKELEKCFISYKRSGKINNRFLIRWAYDIAKGMEYLTSKHVMHGDLAARNILLSGGKDGHLIAKISDFGLSKGMYTSKYYKKMERNYVPWKWMAIEFLDSGTTRKQPVKLDFDSVKENLIVSSPCFEIKSKSHNKRITKNILEDVFSNDYDGTAGWIYEPNKAITLKRTIHHDEIANCNIVELVEFIAKTADDMEKKLFKQDRVK